MKTIIEIIIKVFLGLVIIFFIIHFGMSYFGNKVYEVRNGETYCKDNKYIIGEVFNDKKDYFCDTKVKGKCIDLNNKYIDNNNNLYLSFVLGNFIGKEKEEINEMLKVDNPRGYIYNLFMSDYENKYYAKSYDDIKRFLKLDYESCKIDFYSNNEIKDLSIDEKNLFGNLEK